ncbi:MAG TPA: Ig-like domain-containing domain [Chitinophagaceae bacterium]
MKLFFSFFLLIILMSAITVFSGCANIVPPAGGPRDSTAPVLLKSVPVDSTRNFKETRIAFTFDDYVEVQNIQQELLMSPTPKQMPEVNFRLNTVTVRIKDTLEANTTYTLDFGDAIKDINEGNVLKNFTYTFSTGPYIDSLTFSGNVLLAETGEIDSTMIVMLHSSSDDSSVVKEKPRYITKLDSKGNFTFKNLPPQTYSVYALKDEGGARLYTSEKQLFAFADSPVVISAMVKPVTLYAYNSAAATSTSVSSSTVLTPGGRRGGGGPTAADRRLRFSTNLTNNQQDLLGDFIISFEQSLKTFDSSKLTLFTDSTFTPVANYRFIKDSTNKKIRLVQTPPAGQPVWKENTLYHLILDKDFAEDSTGKKLLRTDTLSFKTKNLADYGKLRIRFRNLDLSKNPVLLFIQGNNVTQSYPLNAVEFVRDLFLPGDYGLRILYDNNKNGKWDPGEFFGKHQQPELVKPIDRKFIIKPGWENEFEIAL